MNDDPTDTFESEEFGGEVASLPRKSEQVCDLVDVLADEQPRLRRAPRVLIDRLSEIKRRHAVQLARARRLAMRAGRERNVSVAEAVVPTEIVGPGLGSCPHESPGDSFTDEVAP